MYAIRVEEINEDGTRSPFSFGGGDNKEITSEGFVIIGMTPHESQTACAVAIHNTCVASIATAMSGHEALERAAKLVTRANMRDTLFGRENTDNAAN